LQHQQIITAPPRPIAVADALAVQAMRSTHLSTSAIRR
jgi:hypothetical protein